LVAQLVAGVFNVHQNPQEPLITTMARRFQSLHLLLILDNCEHVLKGCVDLIHRLLRSCPHLVVLATSREVLGLAAETIWRVPPLGVGAADVRNAPEQVVQSEAAALFVERARAVQPGFAMTSRNAASLLEVCRCLEGIPLAIELAARRVNVLGLEQMAERLATQFGILSSNDPTVATRQQTLEKTIQWSYDLLTPAEQVMFDRLSWSPVGGRLRRWGQWLVTISRMATASWICSHG
jgi:non-specific serine/threonine protein kinase